MVYRPILRWKRGEQTAISKLSAHHVGAIEPVLVISNHEFDPPTPGQIDPAFDAKLVQDAQRLKEHWNGSRLSVDLNGLDSDAICAGALHPVEFFFKELPNNLGIHPVVTGLSSEEYVAAVAKVARPPTFRLNPEDLAQADIADFVSDVLDACNFNANQCDLIVDLGYIQGAGQATITAKGALQSVPVMGQWRSITLAGGAFPPNLSPFQVGTQYLRRSEWLAWQSVRTGMHVNLEFGDYATIHPLPVEEGLDPRTMNPTASVRYTTGDYWLLLRGEGVKNKGGPGFAQFKTHADKLILMSEYRGSGFSYGDEKISRIATGTDKPGNLEQWITIGVNHHIAEVVDLIANLP